MINNHRYCVIMCGGIGSRFWPYSRTNRPKQFIDFLGTGRTLLQMSYDRVLPIVPKENVIVVAHRLSTIRNVDRILVFDKGKVVEEGNFNELLEKNGLFRKMYDAAQSE